MEHRVVEGITVDNTICYRPDDVILMLTRIIGVIPENVTKLKEELGENIRVGVLLPNLNQDHGDVKVRFIWERIKGE